MTEKALARARLAAGLASALFGIMYLATGVRGFGAAGLFAAIVWLLATRSRIMADPRGEQEK